MASMDESSRQRRRVTFGQLESLWEFLNSHRDIATGYNKSAQARDHSKRMWQTVAETLNSLGEGAFKDWRGWSNYWIDYKAKLKRKVAAVRQSQTRTGGGPSDTQALSMLENKFLSLLGEGFGMGLASIQVDPFPDLPQSSTAVQQNSAVADSEPNVPPPDPALHLDLPLQEAPQDVVVEGQQPLPEQPVPSQNVQQSEAPHPARRRRRQGHISQDAARSILIEHSRLRLRAVERQSELMERLLDTLHVIANDITRIARRPETTNE